MSISILAAHTPGNTAGHRIWLIALMGLATWLLTGGPAMAQSLRVMTFNVRLPVDSDGANRWETRRELMAKVVARERPDLIGTQELYQRQGDELVARLPQYAWFGQGRRGGHEDEHMGVFYRKDRLRVLASGDFWLSDTPEVPGSITWGNLYPRMVTWARFERMADGAIFTFYNTHLPYRDEDEPTRVRGAELIVARLRQLPGNGPVILTGDFNTAPDGPTHALLTATLTDAWTAAPQRRGPPATFHDFTGHTGQAESRIDWILFRGLKAKSARTVTTHHRGRYPSDHFPVVVDFELPRARK